MIAEYTRLLPDKELLRAKLHEVYALLAPADEEPAKSTPTKAKRKGAKKVNQHFYEYETPRPLDKIEKDIDGLEKEIMALLKEVVA